MGTVHGVANRPAGISDTVAFTNLFSSIPFVDFDAGNMLPKARPALVADETHDSTPASAPGAPS